MTRDIPHKDQQASDMQPICAAHRQTTRSWWRHVVAVMLLTVLGTMMSEAWAADVQFIIVNNKGKLAFNYTMNTTKLAVDAKAKSIYAENFRFYTSESDAIADAGGYAEGATIGSGTGGNTTGPFYVRYDAKSTRIGSDSSQKYLIRCRNRSGVWWYIYFDKDDGNKLKMTTGLGSDSNMKRFLWQFSDGGDPYDVYITSDYADETVAGGTVSVAGVSTSNKTPYVTYQAKVADASYDQSATSNFTMQSFFFTQGTSNSPYKYGSGWSSIWSNSVHLVGAYNGITYRYRDGSNSGWENNMPYYLCANGNPSASGAMSNGYQWHCFRSWRAEDTSSSNVSQIQVVNNFAIFHIVNKAGAIAISKLEESPAATLSLPNEIKSPYITSGNYKFFNTQEEAAAYSSAATDSERTTAAATAITTLAAVTDNTVYVGYYYDADSKPSSLPALDGGSWFRILNRYGNADNYFYSKLNNNGRADNSSICNSTAHETGSFTDDYHLWKFTGNDPYAIYLSNKWMNENKGNGSDMPIRYGGIAQGWFRQMSGYYATGYPMIMLGYDATYVNMAIVSEANRLSDYEYLYFLGANGTAGSNNVQFMRNQNITSNIYKTDRTAAALLKFIELPTFNYHVTTPSGAELTYKAIYDLNEVTDIPMPAALTRKFISSYRFYSDAACTNEITTSAQVLSDCTLGANGYDIYVKYTVGTLPFTVSTDYAHARWYRIKVVEGDVYAHLSETAQVAGSDDGYTHDYQYAFFGDPYEFKVINREGGNGYYLGVAAGSTDQTPILPIADGAGALNTWEILPAASGEADTDIRLRVFGTASTTPYYCGFYSGKACYFSASAITMRPEALPQRTYTYHIIDRSGRDAIKASVIQDFNTPIIYDNLPKVIRSPYIEDETLTGYLTRSTAGTSYGRTTYNLSSPTTETPTTDADIYVRYTTDHLTEKPLRLRGTRAFNVKFNGEYAFDNAGTLSHESTADNLANRNHLWYFLGNDPYAVQIKNAESGKFITNTATTASHEEDALTLNTDVGTGSFYIMMSGSVETTSLPVQMELMAATGDAYDASTNYYNIGRTSDVQLYGKSTKAQGADELQTIISLSNITTRYFLIDKAHKLIEGNIAGTEQELYLPDAWRSPLVSQYKYYSEGGYDSVSDTYTPTGELSSIADDADGNIYVTYDVGTGVIFDTTDDDTIDDDVPMYMLKFSYGQMFHQEDGSDGVMSTQRKAIYPYSNGDANLYVYGQERWDLQLESGASTRGRWPWFVVSPTSDPYHVKIMSRQSQGKSTSHNYFRTFVVDGRVATGVTTRGDRVVTGGVIDGVDYGDHKEPATEYMVLSTPSGKSRLVTVNKLNDGTTTERRTVTSFEQYWKTYETVSAKGTKSYETLDNPAFTDKGITLHRYQAWANARPIDPVDPTKQNSKDYTYDYHWFQTISMEEGVAEPLEAGAFTFEEISLSAVLVLLDQHGWEVARVNLPNGPEDPKRAELYDGLKKYSSPMVKRYHYWKVGSKVPGYHKYEVSDYAVDASGNEYTSSKLGFLDPAENGLLPDYELQGRVGNQSRDWYVTYDVKDEYAGAYVGAATEAATKASAYMIGQGDGSTTKWATANATGTDITPAAAPVTFATITDEYLWYLQPNFNIDREMGYRYAGETGAQEGALSKAETDAQNYSEGRNGFDPYNLQIRSKKHETKYFTASTTAAALDKGIWKGTGSTAVTLQDKSVPFHATGFDQTTLNVTNATFMVVDDGNGNMRLMPRFDNTVVETTFTSLATQQTAEPKNDTKGTQTTLLTKPTTYTYHIINRNGREALTYTDHYMTAGAYTPSLPTHLRAFGTSNFRYYPRSEFDPTSLMNSVYRLVNTSAPSHTTFSVQGNTGDIYVLYDVTASAITSYGFDGTKMYNLKLQDTNFMSYVAADGTVTAAKTILTTDEAKAQENIWRIETTGGDPYQARLYSFRNHETPLGVSTLGNSPTTAGNQTYQTFILTDWDNANSKFELLAANSGTTENVYAYLTYVSGPKVSSTNQHQATDNLAGFKLIPAAMTITYKLYDLSGNRTLQCEVSDVTNVTPSLPEFMRSPLVADDGYSYWQDEARSTPLTTLSAAVSNTVYVSYVPLPIEEVALKLDGSEAYTFHTKSHPETSAMGDNGQVSLRSTIGKRENYYEHTLLGRIIDGKYDPYDVAVYSPFQKRYWTSGNIQNTSANRQDNLTCNATNTNSRFMILRGTTDSGITYVQIAQKKMNGSTYYPDLTGAVKYVYHNGTNFSTGQGRTETTYTHNGGEEWQLHAFQPTHIYHILNMQGKEAVSGVEPRLIIPSVTTPLVPTVLNSPVVNRYHYYDISAFDVSDGVYTLKSGATELRYLSDATTNDIYVTYTRADLDKQWDLNGSKTYNIIFAPDALTWDGITETLNSYFGYNAGLQYWEGTDQTDATKNINESNRFQVTGSYCTSYIRHIVVNDASKKGTDTGSRVYEVEDDLTDEQIKENTWLWSFSGSDPYAIEVHSMTDPTKYIYRNSDSGGYTVGLTLGTTTNVQRRTFMLTGRGTGDATRFNIMASGAGTNGTGPYSYQYLGRSYHDNPHRNTRRGVVLQGFHEWSGWNYTYNQQPVIVKIVPQNEGYVTYIVKNKQGNEAIRMKVKQSLRIIPELPDAIRSPYAKNFKYYTSDGTTEITSANAATYVVNNATILVKDYDVDTEALEAAELDLTGSATENNSYNIQAGGMYLYYNVGDNTLTADASPAKFDDTVHEWYLVGNASGSVDPYDVRLQSKQNTSRYIELATYDNTREWTTLPLIADANGNDVHSFILMNGQLGKVELLAATGSKTNAATEPSVIKNRLAYLGFNGAPQLLGVGDNDANPKFQSGMNQVQVVLRRPYSGVTYHIVNLNGLEAVRYTVEAAKGDVLQVPEEIRSPFATNWQFWSDEECTSPLSSVPDSYANVYVTYTYDDNTSGQLQLDGARFYNMKIADRYIQEADGAINALPNETLDTDEAMVTANLWAFNGQTVSKGIDPYALHLVNKAYSDIYAGAPLSYANDSETTMQMSDGETQNFRSTFFLVGSDPAGPYELVLASGANITDNVLAIVNRHDNSAVNLNREAIYQHGNAALQLQMTSPVGKYLYKVYDRSGNLAIQAWGDGVAGDTPVIPDVIRSPLVSQFYYDRETLPYSTGAEEVVVTYDFDADKLMSPNLLGKKLYNLKFRNDYFIQADGSDVSVRLPKTSDTDVTYDEKNLLEATTTTLESTTEDIYIWKPTGQFGVADAKDIDPYCITLKHSNGNVICASAIGLGTNNLGLSTSGTYDKFILLEGTDGRYEFMAATGNQIGSTYGADGYDMFAYLAITDGNVATLGRGEAYSRGKTAIQVEMVPFQYEYTYIVIKNNMKEAIRFTETQEGGDPALLPWQIRSPLIDDDEFKYYLASSFSTVGDGNTDFVFSSGATAIASLPYEGTTIYVRYDYSPKAGGLDLSGVVTYQITHDDNGTVNYMYYDRSQTKSSVQNNNNASASHITSPYLWKLEANNDPYDVAIKSMYLTREASNGTTMTTPLGYLTDFCPWNYGNHTYEVWTANDVSTYTNSNQSIQDDFRAYPGNRFAIVGHEDGTYRLMTLVPHEKRISGTETHYFITGGTGTWYKTTYSAPNAGGGLSIQFLPTTTHNYRFHLTTKIDGRKLEVEKENIMARDIFSLPEELVRKYCDYTATYYVNKNGSTNQEDWSPKTKENFGETGVEAETLALDGTDFFPYFTEYDGDDTKWVDIYVDYKAHQHYKTDADGNYIQEGGDYVIDPEGMPFNVMAWNKASVQRLLNNEGGFTDAIFQINDYESLVTRLGTFNLRRCDYLYFMVLKTNDDFSNNNGQYFLRREENGRISWLNNDYRIYQDKTKNYKQWPYSRCAEAYRDNDHSVFEEKKWLFCFAGDPYDFYIFNANSTVEETYNTITEQKEFVRIHRGHLVNYTTLTNKAGTTTEYAVNTPSYAETSSALYRWGLTNGQGANSNATFSLITGEFNKSGDEYKNPSIPNVEEKPLYWRMDKSAVEGTNEVMLQTRDAENTTLDYNIKVLPYEPTRFEEVRFVIKRDDEIGTTTDGIGSGTYLGEYPQSIEEMGLTGQAATTESRARNDFMDTQLHSGTVRMFSSVGDRLYAKGDVIDINSLPLELQRQFCKYKMYTDDYRNEGTVTLPYCPVRGTIQKDSEGNIIYNSVGKAMYNYYAVDSETGDVVMVDPPGNQTPRGAAPMTVYFKYSVTTDKFLKQRPTTSEVTDMVANNDHVYFMDFADPTLLKGGKLDYNTGHHAYYHETATFHDQIEALHEGVLAEKMKWDGSSFVYDTDKQFNDCQYKTTSNRMESVPENLKWYFVGDPYKLQVYCTEFVMDKNEPEANLCRFDPTESSFQFVVDCVHFRTPDPSIIDERKTLTYTDEDGNAHEVDNNNYGKPYYSDFYWEVVPAMSEEPDAFALRFRADNQLLGYRNVFYYLAHDGIKRTYREAQSENPKAYGINLSYDENNELAQTGKYKGFHSSNDENCVIRLIQPAKVYFTAYKETFAGEPVVKEELSEYFGVGETLKEVPRHLQRKYVKYGNLQYQKNNNDTWNDTSFDFTLTKNEAYNLQNCKDVGPVHTIANGWVYQEGTKYDANGEPVLDADNKFILTDDDYTKCRASYKFRVTYEVDDITRDDIHLFTTPAEFANADVTPQWLDVKIGNSWVYYDKTNVDSSTGVENQTTRTSAYPITNDNAEEVPDGWDIGIKGLHWAFVGDPYKFTILNRRRWEDQQSPRTGTGDDIWLGTGYAQMTETVDGTPQNVWYNYTKLGDTNANLAYGRNGTGGNDANGNTEWSLMMCKTGTARDYFIRTASPKTSSVDGLVGDYSNSRDPSNMTNDYARLTGKAFTSTDVPATKSNYVLETFRLDTKTSDIQKADIRTAVAEDFDGADNDCFDAIVRIYNINGELKATMKHVEVTYGDVLKSLPRTLKRYGCNYTECYQLYYPSYTPTMLASPTSSETLARTAAIEAAVKSLNSFEGENKMGTLTTFSDATLNKAKAITDLNGRKYLEIAYVYEVDDDVAQFFTSTDDALQNEYYWSNAYFQWDQVYRGTNVRVVTYENIFDHYEYNADGHIVNEVYKQVERVEYKSGEEISTPAYGWINSHGGSDLAYADERSQSEDNRQKWSFVGDPYDFELKNYAQYLVNPHSAMTSDGSDADTPEASNTDSSHWAIVQGLQKTEVINGKTVKVTDEHGNPVYVYYLALIDDETGLATDFVTFDRAAENKDLTADKQFLYLKGSPLENEPTGNHYTKPTKDVRPFYLAELMSYANWVVYHLVIAHQHSLDYQDNFEEMASTAHKNAAKERIDKHLLEFLKYKYPAIMNSGKTDLQSSYLTNATLDGSGDTIKVAGVYTAIKDRLTTDATNDAILAKLLKSASLRDVVNDSINDYSVARVGIGNTLTVPWYMKRQFCSYDLYQRDVLRSVVSDRIVYEDDGVTPKTFIDENGVEQIAKEIDWVSVTKYPDTEGYATVVAENGGRITKLNDSHRNRMVVVDVVYHVNEDEFRFADQGRSTTAWYSMMTNNDKDGLMNFSYKDGIGARHGREVHYTNNYLWAPDGDPYGFVMRSRYATINGTGWDNVAVTTIGRLPDDASVATGSADPLAENQIGKVTLNADFASDVVTKTDNALDVATYTGATGNVPFNDKRVTHPGRGYDSRRTWGARNAIYEMFAGNFDKSFLMHPTSAYVDINADKFSSFYMIHNTTDHKTELQYFASAKDLRSNRDANWRMMTTPEQLLPYFERSGYVGGLQPDVANRFENQSLYSTLQSYKATYRTDASVIDFKTIDQTRKLVYGGTFYTHDGTELRSTDPRPTADGKLPLKFVSQNLVPLERGYHRIVAFSRDALDKDGEDLDGTGIKGIQGPRYISGYRFQSEKDYRGYEGAPTATLTAGSRWLHFIETDEEHTTIKTFEELNAKIRSLEGASHYERDIEPHPAMRGNIEILPAEYDPSSIFYFTPTNDSYDRFRFGTQNMEVVGSNGITRLDATGTDFRMDDIGGTAVTMRVLNATPGNWDSDETNGVAKNIQTNYLCIDPTHRYRITINADNEMKEIGDSYAEGEDYWKLADLDYGIQDTKWLLQPVGVQTEWPYNQKPLSVRVHKGGQKPDPSSGEGLTGTENKDNNYYASLYVPFDTRLAKTVDAAFTNTNETPAPKSITLKSVSQLNNMGNPQFIPAGWPVVLRTSQPVTSITKEDGTSMVSEPHVNLFLPNTTKTSIPESEAKIKLYGEYLEKTLTAAEIELEFGVAEANQNIMVVGLPFKATGAGNNVFGINDYSGEWYAYNTTSAVGFYTNENWQRGYFVANAAPNGVATQALFDAASADVKKVVDNTHWAKARTATNAQRDNKYVYHNKVYYVFNKSSAPVKGDYFYFLFDDEEEEQEPEEQLSEEQPAVPRYGVYDLSGRMIRTKEAVMNGTWRRNLKPGVYIVNGRKMTVSTTYNAH